MYPSPPPVLTEHSCLPLPAHCRAAASAEARQPQASFLVFLSPDPRCPRLVLLMRRGSNLTLASGSAFSGTWLRYAASHSEFLCLSMGLLCVFSLITSLIVLLPKFAPCNLKMAEKQAKAVLSLSQTTVAKVPFRYSFISSSNYAGLGVLGRS